MTYHYGLRQKILGCDTIDALIIKVDESLEAALKSTQGVSGAGVPYEVLAPVLYGRARAEQLGDFRDFIHGYNNSPFSAGIESVLQHHSASPQNAAEIRELKEAATRHKPTEVAAMLDEANLRLQMLKDFQSQNPTPYALTQFFNAVIYSESKWQKTPLRLWYKYEMLEATEITNARALAAPEILTF